MVDHDAVFLLPCKVVVLKFLFDTRVQLLDGEGAHFFLGKEGIHVGFDIGFLAVLVPLRQIDKVAVDLQHHDRHTEHADESARGFGQERGTAVERIACLGEDDQDVFQFVQTIADVAHKRYIRNIFALAEHAETAHERLGIGVEALERHNVIGSYRFQFF